MHACTRCGRHHLDAETVSERRLSCTEVKSFWAGIRALHEREYGHPAEMTTDASGARICQRCKRPLLETSPDEHETRRAPAGP